jgi:hypothetical protein
MLTTSNEGFGFLLQVDVANLEKKLMFKLARG